MAIDMAQFHAMFFDECEEHLDHVSRFLGTGVEDLPRSAPELAAIVEGVRRIKDGGQLFGFDRIVELADGIEVRLEAGGGHGGTDATQRESLLDAYLELRDAFGIYRAVSRGEPGSALTASSPAPAQPSRHAPVETGFSRTGRYLTFSLADDLYAVAADSVREVRDYQGATPIPAMPHAIRGVTSVGGERVPVVDLRSCLEAGSAPDSDFMTQLIVTVAGRAVAALVDTAEEIVSLTVDPARLMRRSGDRSKVLHVLGTAKLGKRIIRILDIERLMLSAGVEHVFGEYAVG